MLKVSSENFDEGLQQATMMHRLDPPTAEKHQKKRHGHRTEIRDRHSNKR